MLLKLFIFALMVVGAMSLVVTSPRFLGPCPSGTHYSAQQRRCVSSAFDEGEPNLLDLLYD
uniref:SFRICE_024742 n=1 Tax=Spodoptera frugiperda TaxID=7108 RepID=A0A2H1W6V4_SPOFR